MNIFVIAKDDSNNYYNFMDLLLDFGATKTRAAKAVDDRSLQILRIFPTPQNFQDVLAQIQAVTDDEPVDKIVAGVRALDKDKSRLRRHPNLPLWEGVSIKDQLEKTFGCGVVLENDAALAGLGEAIFGAGKDHKIIMYYTVSSGVGGARIFDKKIDESCEGFEPGQQIINFDKQIKTLEKLVSGKALEKRYGVLPEKISNDNIWDTVASQLAIGIYNSILHWSPNIVVIGGSVTKSLHLERIQHHLNNLPQVFSELPPLAKAELEESVLYGALHLLKS